MNTQELVPIAATSAAAGGVTALLLHHLRRNQMARKNLVPAGSSFVSSPEKPEDMVESKIAGNAIDGGGGPVEDAGRAAAWVGEKVDQAGDAIGRGLGNLFSKAASFVVEKSLKVPLMVGAAGLGAYGGFKVIDSIAKKKESERAAKSLARAKDIYMQSLPDFDSGKIASDLTPAVDLLCLKVANSAEEGDGAGSKQALDAAEIVLGGGVTIALAAMLSGHMAAKKEEDQSRPKFRPPDDGISRMPYGVPEPAELGVGPKPQPY